MNTPIIDALWGQSKGLREYYAALEATAKKLESDRADLLEALEEFYSVNCRYGVGGLGLNEYIAANKKARAALAKVKANFPKP